MYDNIALNSGLMEYLLFLLFSFSFFFLFVHSKFSILSTFSPFFIRFFAFTFFIIANYDNKHIYIVRCDTSFSPFSRFLFFIAIHKNKCNSSEIFSRIYHFLFRFTTINRSFGNKGLCAYKKKIA